MQMGNLEQFKRDAKELLDKAQREEWTREFTILMLEWLAKESNITLNQLRTER
jgi:hypothetical protein